MAEVDRGLAISILLVMPRKGSPRTPEPSFVSQQVTEARRYYLNLNPQREAPLVVVCGGVDRMRPEYVVRRREFPYFAIELVVDGEGSLILNGRRFHLASGVVFAYGPCVAHTIRNHPENRMRKYYSDFAGHGLLRRQHPPNGELRARLTAPVHPWSLACAE
jgi:hypothetical protein